MLRLRALHEGSWDSLPTNNMPAATLAYVAYFCKALGVRDQRNMWRLAPNLSLFDTPDLLYQLYTARAFRNIIMLQTVLRGPAARPRTSPATLTSVMMPAMAPWDTACATTPPAP